MSGTSQLWPSPSSLPSTTALPPRPGPRRQERASSTSPWLFYPSGHTMEDVPVQPPSLSLPLSLSFALSLLSHSLSLFSLSLTHSPFTIIASVHAGSRKAFHAEALQPYVEHGYITYTPARRNDDEPQLWYAKGELQQGRECFLLTNDNFMVCELCELFLASISSALTTVECLLRTTSERDASRSNGLVSTSCRTCGSDGATSS